LKELDYRNQIQKVLQRIETALADVDPDKVECEQAMGAMTLTFSDQSRCILSAQPSVQQLWVAMAARGTAYHFNFQDGSGTWVDDRGRGIEVVQLVKEYIKEFTGLEIQI
jgi:CyaY protein